MCVCIYLNSGFDSFACLPCVSSASLEILLWGGGWCSIGWAYTKAWVWYPISHKLAIVVHACNYSTQETEAGESGVQGHLWLHWEFKTSVLPFFSLSLPFSHSLFPIGFLSIYTCFLYMIATETSTYKFNFNIWLSKCTISLNLQKSHKVEFLFSQPTF